MTLDSKVPEAVRTEIARLLGEADLDIPATSDADLYRQLRRHAALVVELGYRLQNPLLDSPYAAIVRPLTDQTMAWLDETRGRE